MKFQAIFLIVLVASTSAISLFQKYPINYSNNRNIYAVLSEVRAKMAAGGPLDSVIHLLENIRGQVQDEQARHDGVWNDQSSQCQAEISFRNQEITDATEALDNAQKQLNRCEHDLAVDQINLANNLQTQKDTMESLKNLIDARRAENELYLQRVTDHNDALQAISEAEELLEDIFSGEASFVQLSSMSSKILKHSIKVRTTKSFAPVVSILAQIAARKVEANTATLEKVKALLVKLSENVKKSLDNYITQEKADNEKFEQRKSELETELKNLREAEAGFRTSISNLENCVARENQIVNASKGKLSRNTDLLNQATSMCENFKSEYESSTAKRNDEIKLIAEVRRIVEARYGQISEEVTKRGVQEKGEWEAYENAFKYQKTTDFEHQSGDFNQAGASGAGFERAEHLEGLF